MKDTEDSQMGRFASDPPKGPRPQIFQRCRWRKKEHHRPPRLWSSLPRMCTGHHLTTLLSSLFLTLLVTNSHAQYRPNWPSPYVQREIFVLNLEDGYFGCQVNESTDFLQLFELSKLCDGVPQCFQGSDEVSLELKCSDRSECHNESC